jgi:hypothetical protein
MACFGHGEDEPADEVEARWNGLAQQMWRAGLEPMDDEPWFTVIGDGIVWDHYILREVGSD